MKPQPSCCLLRTVLLGTFEWRELANLLADAGIGAPALRRRDGADVRVTDHERGLGALTVRSAMALFSQSPSFRRLLGRRLRLLHGETLELVRSTEPAVLDALLPDEEAGPFERAGWVWALVSDRREGVAALAAQLLPGRPARPEGGAAG